MNAKCKVTFRGKTYTKQGWVDLLVEKEAVDGFRSGMDFHNQMDVDGTLYEMQMNEQTGEIISDKMKKVDPVTKNDTTYGTKAFYPWITSFSKGRYKAITNQKMKVIIGKLKSAFPQLDFVEETSTSMKEKGYGKTMRGFVKGNSVHYNVDRINGDTLFHEMQHIWNQVVKIKNPELYQEMESYVKKMVAEGNADYVALYESIEGKYRELKTKEDIIEEMLATVGGFRSQGSIETFFKLAGSNTHFLDYSLTQRLWNGVKGFISRIMNTLRNFFFSDKRVPEFMNRHDYRFNEFFDDMREAVLNGETQIVFTPEEMEAISHIFKFSKDLNITSINNLKDIASMLNSKERDATKMVNLDEDQLTEWIFNNIKKPNAKANYTWKIGGYKAVYPIAKFKDNDEALKREIRKDIVPKYTMFETDIKKNMRAFVARINELIATSGTKDQETATTTIAEEIFGEGKFTDHVVRELTVMIGSQFNIKEIMPYSELATHNDLKIRGLYQKDFEGFDPLVVIHDNEAKQLSVSILDITSKPLGARTSGNYELNILSDIMTDAEYTRKGGSEKWGARAYNIRNLMLVMQMMAMKKGNPDVRIRNIGTIEIHKDQIKSFMVTDIEDALKIVKMMTEVTDFDNVLRSDSLKSVFSDKSLFIDNYAQSYAAILNMHIRELATTLDSQDPSVYGIKTMAERQAKLIFSDHISAADLLKIYKHRQTILESKMSKDDLFKDHEYRLIAKAVKEIQGRVKGNVSSTRDMSWASRKVLNSYNVDSPVIQWAIQTAMVAKDILMQKYREYHEDVNPNFEKVRIEYIKTHPSTATSQIIRDKGSDYTKPCFAVKKARLIKDTYINGKLIPAGKYVDVIDPSVILSMNSEDKSKDFTKIHLELNEKVHKHIRERWIDNIFHEMLKDPSSRNALGEVIINRVEAEKKFYEFYEEGMVPVMEKSANELIMSGEIKQGTTKGIRSISQTAEFFDDMIDGVKAKKLEVLSARFADQHDTTDRYAKAGLEWVNGELTVLDYEKNVTMSTNLERIANYFMLDGIRTEVLNERLLPVVRNANAMLYAVNEHVIQKNNIKYMEETINKIVFRKNRDADFEKEFKVMGKKFKMSSIVRGALHSFQMGTLFLRLPVAGKNAVYNEVHLGLSGVAASIANLGIPVEMQDVMPTTGDILQAHYLFAKDFRKQRAMALKMQIINRTERDMLENPMLNVAFRYNILTEATGYLLNQFGDMNARMMAMCSWMLREESYDAYHFDKKTGVLTYDIKKDKRYYPQDKSEQTEQQKALVRGLKERMVDQGLMKETDKVFPMGHDYTMINNTLKWYGDKWIVGGVDEHTKVLLSNTYLGAMASQFRMFSFDPMFNMGLNADKRSSYGGSTYVAIKNEEGEYISVPELRENMGAFQSINQAMMDLLALRKVPIKEWPGFMSWWKSQQPQSRHNLTNAMVRLFFWAGVAAMVYGLRPEDEDRYAWILSDVVLIYTMMEWTENPIPLASGILALVDISVGNKKPEGLVRFTGGFKDVYSAFLDEKNP